MIKLAAILATAATFGSMLFFAAVVAPLVFSKLPTPTAGAFIRQLFPVYFVVMAATTALAALAATMVTPADALVLAAVSVGFLYSRMVLLPRIDQVRERALAGDERATQRFRRLHRASTVLNGLQLIAVTAALIRLVG
ncbi:MAG TPA: DUF4149 domain-containing protein [Candidatus Sulfotelmatobacter sp.]|nr:DUF4149 domain-containing protein [Candidatus Sulfotelmatobacter sp.]